eukprot:TRINITY_DN1437_c0_g1_i1.p1 TRINITY_DN1437_c0_g1~~TRINITY_DN1437_c0_g1_i1.p1  ORF type:complete len:262 (-),score=37.22 TRINITY_DN1437_c0_g1_i1:136-921(-)
MSQQEQGLPPVSYICPELVVVDQWDLHGRPVLDSSEEGESMNKVFSEVVINVGQNFSLGVGTLFLTSRRLVWKSNEQQTSIGYQVGFSQITMHAICKDIDSYPQPCIYCQLEGEHDEQQTVHGIVNGSHGFFGDGNNQIQDGQESTNQEAINGEEDAESEEGGEDIIMECSSEIYIVPLDSQQLDEIFKCMCECASLNPDAMSEEEDGMYYDEEEVYGNLTEQDLLNLIEAGQDEELQEEEIQELIRQDPERFDDPSQPRP